jgi:tetratricopeptide (TPR) repeat protein
MTTQGAKVLIRVIGSFAIQGSAGEDRTPRGRRACAIIAMLALSPEGKRPRTWLQDKLWSTRAPEQGAASLRQSIHEARAALGEDRDLLVADKFALMLDRTRCIVDLDDDTAARPGTDLLEGLDLGDDEFEGWLREQRASFRERKPAATPSAAIGASLIAERSQAAPSTWTPSPGTPATTLASQHKLLILSGERGRLSEASIIADSLLDSVAKSVAELGIAKVLDRRMQTGETSSSQFEELTSGDALALHGDSVDTEAKKIVRLAMLQIPEKSLAWSSTLQLSSEEVKDIHDPRALACINLVVNVAIDRFSKNNASQSEQAVASALCHAGVQHLFKLGPVNFEAADKLFSRAFDIDPRGLYLAWRAFLRTFLLAERQFTSREKIEQEAIDFVQRALELEPHNSYVAALGAHVHTIMRRSYVAAYELAERSIQLNHANPIGWACLGIAKSHLGKSAEGMRHTMLAREIAGTAPYRYQLDTLSCIASTMAGDMNRAIHMAEASHALAPSFAPPMRYLSALYAHKGEHDLSHQMVQKLKISEPDFDYDKLRDTTYPAAGLHRSSIIASLPKKQV